MGKTFSRDRLIVFGRYPAPGLTKTRLIPALGPVGAANLQRHLTEKTFLTAKEFAVRYNTTMECCFEGGTPQKIRCWLGPIPTLSFQHEGDLGQRMRSALFDALNEGNKRVVLLGTDITGLNIQILKNAFDALLHHDIVLGPSTDGGYWLMGLKRPIDIFQQIDWSTPMVLDQTLAQARHMGLTVHLLKFLSDMDTPEDLRRWRPDEDVPKIFLTVVIPAFNEEDHIHRSISSATDRDVEVVVVDGGSTDSTINQAESLGVRVIHSPLGRAPPAEFRGCCGQR